MKALKTPLRYPGGKSRACTKLAQHFPDLKNYKEYREPFVGGGSVALYVTKMYPHLTIWVNDLYQPLYNFWKELQHDGQALQDKLWSIKNMNPDRDSAKELFLKAKEDVNDETRSDFDRAADFYIVNKCSFSGLTESSSFSPQASESNFSFRGIEKLGDYGKLIENWIITSHSYERLFTSDWDRKGIFMYLDPPYDIKQNLYGNKGEMHKRFDHDEFAAKCDDYTSPMLISYNSSQLVRDRFKDWNAAEFDLTYTMRSVGDYMSDQQHRKELLLLNYAPSS
jgi:DNA adenine methylase